MTQGSAESFVDEGDTSEHEAKGPRGKGKAVMNDDALASYDEHATRGDEGAINDANEPPPPPSLEEKPVKTIPPLLPHIIPTSPWLVDLAVRFVTKYNMDKPCLLCVYRTLYHLFEVGEDSTLVLEGKAVCACNLHIACIPEKDRVDRHLPAQRVQSVPDDVREVAARVGAVIREANTPVPPERRAKGTQRKPE